jgi:hypothetical protein
MLILKKLKDLIEIFKNNVITSLKTTVKLSESKCSEKKSNDLLESTTII